MQSNPLRESGCRVSKTERFLRLGARRNLLRESGCRVSKTEDFLRFFAFPSNPLRRSGFRENRGKSAAIFAFPKGQYETVCLIMGAKISIFHARNLSWRNVTKLPQENCDICMAGATLCGNPGLKCQKLMVFCNFCMPEFVRTQPFIPLKCPEMMKNCKN